MSPMSQASILPSYIYNLSLSFIPGPGNMSFSWERLKVSAWGDAEGMCAVDMGTAMSRVIASDLWENAKSPCSPGVGLRGMERPSSGPSVKLTMCTENIHHNFSPLICPCL